MVRLPRVGSALKSLFTITSPNDINWINKRSSISTTPIYRRATPPSSFTAKGSIPAWDELLRHTTEKTIDGMPMEQWHKGMFGRYIDSKLGDGGLLEDLERLRRINKRFIRIREVLDGEIAVCKNAEDEDQETLVQQYKKYAVWCVEVISDRIAELEAYEHELREH